MRRRLPAITVVVALLALAVVLHALTIAGMRRISHDDTISYLAATGHQGEFQQVVDEGLPPTATWVTAADWQSFTRIDDPLPLLRIARDLGEHDIHPFVYFWVLHTWSLAVGVQLWTGPALNVVLHVATAAVLWVLTRDIVGRALPAWAAVGVWAALPAVARTAVSTRQYSLAGLWSVALAVVFLRTRERASAVGLVGLAALTAVGMLTLYTFGLVVAGLGAVAAVDLLSRRRRHGAWRQLVAMAVGGVVFLACQPWIREVLARQQDQAEPYTLQRLITRVRVVFEELPRFAVLGDLPTAATAAVWLGALVLAGLAWWSWPRARPVVWLAVWLPTAMIVAYVAAVSPGAAYEERYFSIALPFVALLPVLAWRAVRGWPATAAAVTLVAVLAWVNVAALADEANAPPAETLDGDRPIVLDNLARGVLLRILWDAPPDVDVYAADQPTLLATTDRWLDCQPAAPCHDAPLLLTTQVQYEATRAGQAALLRAADERRDVQPADDLGAIAERYRLSAPTTASSPSSDPERSTAEAPPSPDADGSG